MSLLILPFPARPNSDDWESIWEKHVNEAMYKEAALLPQLGYTFYFYVRNQTIRITFPSNTIVIADFQKDFL